MAPSVSPETALPAGDLPDALDLFERLDVGPVRLERRRLIAPYRITRLDGSADATELIYSWETDVFDPGEPADRNLADMIAAQLALNYGLFCRRMVFHGLYDRPDRSFLRDMAENTAREIYVKKFLETNPFLVGAAAEIPAVRLRKYCRARLEFPEAGRARPGWRAWETHRNRHCVLSSGGKDSLVSHGLLREIGMESHPIFVNESGRHWFTALNAYRHFRDSEPRTGRVWVNSDRVFAWMLRRMSFIRPDFADVRADEYPIRLWTVAVFLFGALPLMRKRGIGRLVIGDEFDTTRRENHRGIPHYDGLYDQSRFFDDAMSRYFLRKGWGVRQFSILRPLSELLIERILAARYPELLAQQVSCHAAHKDGDRVRPCGRCEKCRRIVGMLTALGVDPGQCGYTKAQISAGLSALVERGTYAQAEAESAQLFHMLAERGAITLPEDRQPAPRPEVLTLRFDPVSSPPETIPRDLRRPLFQIFLEHAEGAVRRSGRRWESFDPLTDPAAEVPYPFEVDSASAPAEPGDSAPTDEADATFHWGELNWPDAAERFRHVDIVLLPVGAVEQHGPHLPLDTDAFDADYLARRVAEACAPPRPLVLPLIPYGVSYHHDDFPGTVSIGNTTLSRLVYDVGMSVARNGFRKLVIINGHGGNGPALHYAAQMINRDARIFVCVDTGETSDVDVSRLAGTPNDVHAGEIETSTTLAIRPGLVRMDRAERSVPEFSSRYLDFTSKRSVGWYAHTQKISTSGVMGDPTRASAEKGERIWETMIAHLVAFVEELKSMTLDEIHQRRY